MDGVKEWLEKARAGFQGIAQEKVYIMIVVLLYHIQIFALH